jgi:hypothetical protein
MRLPPLAAALHFAGVTGRRMFGRQEEASHKTLRDLPCEIELDRYGNIVRDPVSVQFGRRDAR